MAGCSYHITTDNDEPFSFLRLFYSISFLSASSFYCISFLSASSFVSFFLHPFFNLSKEAGKLGWTWTDPDHSHLLSYRISGVEVLDYQLAALRTTFIRPSFFENFNLFKGRVFYIRSER